MHQSKLTFGLLVGTRGCFSSELARAGRASLLRVLAQAGHEAVILPADATPTGAVETIADARQCAALFQAHRAAIDGVIVSLPNFGEDREKCVAQHCGNYPKSFVGRPVEVDNLSVLGSVLGEESCFGAINAKVAAGPMSFLRVSTDDLHGRIRGYVGQGQFTDDPFAMLGSIAVCHVPGLQRLLKTICREGFEHHVCMVRSHCADVVNEALSTYLGWDIHVHE